MIDALLHKEHTPYREIGHRSVAFVLERAGTPYTMEEVHALVAEIEKLRCFPEVPEALARLQTRYKLVVLSNGDPDMLETAKEAPRHPVRSCHLRRRSQFLQAARGDLYESGGAARPSRERGAVRRKPRVRLHRREIGRHADRVHRSAPTAVRPDTSPISLRSR
jgi:hypothetical protein